MRIKKHYSITKASPYQVYKKLYRRAEKSLAKRGMKMHDKILTKQEWKAYYESEMQHNVELRKEGLKIDKNINRTIVASQKYSKSYKYARHLKEGLERFYEDQYGEVPKDKQVKIRDILEGKVDFDALDDEYWFLRDQGLTAKETAEEIAGLYFGS